MTLFLMGVHLIVAILVAAGWRQGRIHISFSQLVLVFLLPFWGPVIAVSADLHVRRGEKPDHEAESSRFGITDEVYRSIHMVDAGVEDVLPVEDVLAGGSVQQRRKMLLSVLYTGPENFVKPLREAGVNDDTEVVHYAVTALVELRSQYARRILEMDRKLEKNPRSESVLLASADLDEEYINSGIPEHSERLERLAQCRGKLTRLLQIIGWRESAENPASVAEPAEIGKEAADSSSIIRRLGRICLLQGDARAAQEVSKVLIETGPDEEEGYLMAVHAMAASGDGKGIAGIIREAKSRGVYFSPEGRQLLEFWSSYEA